MIEWLLSIEPDSPCHCQSLSANGGPSVVFSKYLTHSERSSIRRMSNVALYLARRGAAGHRLSWSTYRSFMMCERKNDAWIACCCAVSAAAATTGQCFITTKYQYSFQHDDDDLEDVPPRGKASVEESSERDAACDVVQCVRKLRISQSMVRCEVPRLFPRISFLCLSNGSYLVWPPTTVIECYSIEQWVRMTRGLVKFFDSLNKCLCKHFLWLSYLDFVDFFRDKQSPELQYYWTSYNKLIAELRK